MIKSASILISLSLCLLVSYSQQWGDYTLYSVQNSSTAQLIDTNGAVYHSWSFGSSAKTGYSSYLLPGGTILRTVARQGNSFNGGGICGQVQKVDWDGNVLWNYVCSTTTYCSHHDVHPMPNGNVLIIIYELKNSTQVTQAGCKWSHTMWPDMIWEVQPFGTSGGTVVWEWHAWDHLVQDYDPSKDNYGVVGDHPELLDINYNNSQQTKDWMHVNGLDYNEELDQIVFSSHFLNELYVVDHSTTTIYSYQVRHTLRQHTPCDMPATAIPITNVTPNSSQTATCSYASPRLVLFMKQIQIIRSCGRKI